MSSCARLQIGIVEAGYYLGVYVFFCRAMNCERYHSLNFQVPGFFLAVQHYY